MTQNDLEEIKEILKARNSVGTHWDDCWKHYKHRDCAIWKLIREVEKLRLYKACLEANMQKNTQ